MTKLKLRDAAAIAEIVATFGVIVSLLFVAFTINKNTHEVRAGHSNVLFESTRQVELAVGSDAEWSRIVHQVRSGDAALSSEEQFRYDIYTAAMLDLWDQLISRHDAGLFDETTFAGWDDYFESWCRRHLKKSDWERIGWQFAGPMVDRINETAPFRPE